MTFKTRELTVDLVNEISTKEIRFSQGDENSAKLVLNITNEGQELDLSQAKSVRITFKKPDGTTVFQDDLQPINAMKGKYQIILKTQTLAAAGNVYGQVRIFETDRKLDAEPFVFTVKHSYSGDTVVESTNEFTIIQKALEVGEKFKDVDFDPIIKAGALAQGALPKTGGTMTGNIDMDVATGSKSKGIRWKDATGTMFGIESSTIGELILYDYKSAARIWQYDPVSKRFTILADSNLLKNTGDTITGNLTLEGSRDLIFKNANSETVLRNNSTGIFALYDKKNDFVPWSYDPATKKFNVGAVNTNVMKNTGDTMTGSVQFDVKGGASKALRGIVDGQVQSGFLLEQSGFQAYDWRNNRSVFRYLEGTNTFNLETPNTNIVTKTKDGRATLTLSADATNWDTTVGSFADRRGNTVTVKMAVKRNAGSTNNTVATLPVDMRPTSVLTQYVTATDGTVVKVVIDSVGAINIGTDNKNIYLLATYVVD